MSDNRSTDLAQGFSRTSALWTGGRRRYARSGNVGLIALADQCLFTGTNFLTAVLVGRLGGSRELGIYSLCFSLVMIATGLQRSLLISPFVVVRHTMSRSHLKGMRSTVAVLTLCLCSVSSVACLMIAGCLRMPALAVVALAIPAGLARDFVRRLSIAEVRYLVALGSDLLIALLQVGGLLCLAGFANWRLDATESLLLCSFVWLVVGLVGLWKERARFAGSNIRFRTNFNELWPIGRWSGMTQVVSTTQAFLMPWVMAIGHSIELAGIYAACWTLVQIASPAIEAIGNLLEPGLASSAHQENWLQFQERVRRATWILAGTMGSLLIAMLLAGGPVLLLLYGQQYAEYVSVLWVLALAATISNLGIPAGKSLTQLRLAKLNFVIGAASFVVTLLGAVGLLFAVGILGAAWGFVLGASLLTCLKWQQYHRAFLQASQPQLMRQESGSLEGSPV